MSEEKLPIKLHIPEQTLSSLTFCSGSIRDIRKWAKDLPMANTGAAAKLLYLSVRELNQWQTDPQTRYEALEIIRPYIYTICGLLNKHFLQSSVVLDTKQLQVAQLAQALQGHLATGYKVIIAKLISQPKLLQVSANAKTLTLAIHRAISDTGQTILRSYQLYSQPPALSWLEINQLYLYAEANQLLEFTVEDKRNRYISSSTIHDAFVRIHLLGAAKPNNLRQQDLATLYSACELWTNYCPITPAEDESALFIFHLLRDRPAIYRQTLEDNVRPLFRGLKTKPLVDSLKLWAKNPSLEKNITVPKQLSDNLLSHVIQAWGIHWQRSFRRAPTEGRSLKVCLGLSAVHYYSAEQTEFEKHMHSIRPDALAESTQKKTVPFSAEEDVWANAFDAEGGGGFSGDAIDFDSTGFLNRYKEEEDTDQPAKYPAYTVNMINASPGGYSLGWSGPVPSSVQAGEIIGVQEEGVKHWAIGVIRWIRQSSNSQEPQIGIELLAPKAEVGAARLIQKTGNSYPYMRALLLPSIKAIAQPATLLLPHLPFRTGHKVELLFVNEHGRFQLVKRLTSTNSFTQFQYRSTTPVREVPQTPNMVDSIEDDFDNIWNKL